MFDLMLDIAEAVLEELKRNSKTARLLWRLSQQPRKLIQICKTDNSKKISLLSSTENNKTGETVCGDLSLKQ